jgi:hypothetical protein
MAKEDRKLSLVEDGMVIYEGNPKEWTKLPGINSNYSKVIG